MYITAAQKRFLKGIAVANQELRRPTIIRLIKADIHDLLTLVTKTEADLNNTPGLGKATIREIKDLLAGMDLCLGMQEKKEKKEKDK